MKKFLNIICLLILLTIPNIGIYAEGNQNTDYIMTKKDFQKTGIIIETLKKKIELACNIKDGINMYLGDKLRDKYIISLKKILNKYKNNKRLTILLNEVLSNLDPDITYSTNSQIDFEIDDYLFKGSYSIIQKIQKGEYTLYNVNAEIEWVKTYYDTSFITEGGTGTLLKDNKEFSQKFKNEQALNTGNVIFITKNNKLIYTNLEKRFKNDHQWGSGFGGIYDLTNNGIIFLSNTAYANGSNGPAFLINEVDIFQYIDLNNLKKSEIKIEYNYDCDLDKSEKTLTNMEICIKKSEKITEKAYYTNDNGEEVEINKNDLYKKLEELAK